MRFLLHLIARLCFRFRAYNTAVLTTPGPVLLVPNHVSWLDWFFLAAVLDDDWKFVTSSTTADSNWVLRAMMVNRRTFPVDTTSPYAVRDMADYLEKGGRLVLFAEGRLTLSGSLMKVYDGTGFLIRKTNAKIITCYLRGASRVRFVRHKGWRRWFPRVSAHFSPVLPAPAFENVSHAVARQKLTGWLRDRLTLQQFETEMEFGATNMLSAVTETAINIPNRIALEDITFKELTYRRLMIGADLLAAEWRRRLGPASGEHVGVLLPNVNSQPVTLLSLWAAQKVPAMLNFSTGLSVMLLCAQLAGLKHIITSRQFLEKARLNLASLEAAGINLIYLEDVRPGISGFTKFAALVRHTVSTGAGLRDTPLQPEATAVVLFTSGSEGVPKGGRTHPPQPAGQCPPGHRRDRCDG